MNAAFQLTIDGAPELAVLSFEAFERSRGGVGARHGPGA